MTKYNFTKEQLEYEYLELGLSGPQIAKKYHTWENTIYTNLKKYNIPRRPSISKDFRIHSLKSRFKGYKGLRGSYLYHLKYRAIRLNYEYDLDAKFLWKLYVKQNKKCALSGIDIGFAPIGCRKNKNELNTASIDRIDNNKGYTKNNVRWIHKKINAMRSNLTDKEFIYWCTLIHQHNQNDNNLS